MDKQILLLRNIIEDKSIRQRDLSDRLGASLGAVNNLIKKCLAEGLLEKTDDGMTVTGAGLKFLEPYRVDAAVLMAAGMSTRFVPLSYEKPKGLLEVFGEPMVERQIKQLKAAGIDRIALVVGYMKEKFEYLTDKYGVELIINPDYKTKNNIESIHVAADFIKGKNVYILSSDNWLRENIYHTYEPCSWYSANYSEGPTDEWVLETDNKGKIVDTYAGGKNCLYMYGPAYFSREFSDNFIPILCRYSEMPGTSDFYWEHVLKAILNGEAKKRIRAYFGNVEEVSMCDHIEMYVNRQADDIVYEFESLEELRNFDEKYRNDSGSKAMKLVSEVFSVPESKVHKIRCLKAGMTNNSWLFYVGDKSYICRIPGEGTSELINRRQEKAVYDAIKDTGITEELVYFNADTGYKISRFYENSRNADPKSETDMRCCMRLIKRLHESGLKVSHRFDMAERIDYYESLCREVPFADYEEEKKDCGILLDWIASLHREDRLTHIDAVPDNFIFLPGADILENQRDESLIRLIDWEYTGMSDPLTDIAMCAIYAYMEEKGALDLMRYYFDREPTELEKHIVYAYMALGGLLWALWAVYKQGLGVDYGDYTIRMYRYFKKYSKKVEDYIK